VIETAEDVQLRAECDRIEETLAELRELVVPAAWQRIEHVMRMTVGMYGSGLERSLAHARTAGAEPGALDRLIGGDDLLSSLLLLHGLHPQSTEQRARRALAELRSELGLGDAELAIAKLADGVLAIEASAAIGAGAMAPRVAEAIIRRALEAAAPELRSIEVLGVPMPRDPTLVQLRPRREAP
jgi:hypothetical protein